MESAARSMTVVWAKNWLARAERGHAVVATFIRDLFSSRPERIALQTFRRACPGSVDVWSSVISTEADRYVVCVFYGACEPAEYKFVWVSRDFRDAGMLIDDGPYRPKGWR